MSSRVFQSIVHQMRDVIDRTIGIIDETFTVIACSELGLMGETHDVSVSDYTITGQSFRRGNYTYKPFGGSFSPSYFLFVEGTDDTADKYAALLAVALGSIKESYDEKFDRGNFVKNIILDNILAGDIYLEARELHFNSEVKRAVLLIKLISHNDVSVFDVIQNLFPDTQKDFVININETNIALIKEVKTGIETEDLENLARAIIDTLSSEFYTHAVIGIGTTVGDIKELASSFKEAQIAIEVGKVFDNEKMIICYEKLGIARLIYQLPTTMCETFLKEVFRHGSIESLDQETLFTILCFFDNSLNVSETSRKLFVHRNTLVYRLEKIRKMTGLDLREFDQAIVFKIALMVKKYLTSNPIKL